MVQHYEPPASVIAEWDKAFKQQAKTIQSELNGVVLFSEVAEPWKRAPKRYQALTFKQAIKRIETRPDSETRFSSNPRLKSLYMGQSSLLTLRRQHFQRHFDTEWVESMVKSAFEEVYHRLGLKPTERQVDEVDWLSSICKALIWERLHADAIESPFFELEFQVLLAGHLPAGVEGKDWRTCKILYC